MCKIFISFLLSAIILVAMGSDLDVDTNSTLFNTTLTISKSTVHDRMQHWVDAAVPYRLFTRFFLFLLTSIYQNKIGLTFSQSAYYEGYRTDCSGYVSMGWQLSTSYWTGSLTEVCHKITSGIAMGDAILCQVLLNKIRASNLLI